MALGIHGQPGAAAASPVGEGKPQECAPAQLQRLGGSLAWEMAKKVEIVKVGNAQVGEIFSCPGSSIPTLGHRRQ